VKAQFSPNGEVLAVNCSAKSVGESLQTSFFHVMDIKTQRTVIKSSPVGAFAFGQEGKVVFATPLAAGNSIYSYNTETGQMDEILLSEKQVFGSLEASPNTRTVAVAGSTPFRPRVSAWSLVLDDFSVPSLSLRTTVFDAATRQEYRTVTGALPSFSHDGSLLAVTEGTTIRVWPVRRGKPAWLATLLAAAVVGVVWAVRLAYRRRTAARLITSP
jgi:hypothetical protein